MYPKTREEIDKAKKDCEEMLTKRALVSAVAGLSPIIGPDITVDMVLLLDLFPRINRRFGFDPEQIASLDEKVKVVIYQFISVTGKSVVGKCITKKLILSILKRLGIRVASKQVVKFVPFVGPAVSGIISFGLMKSVGNLHIRECVNLANELLKKENI